MTVTTRLVTLAASAVAFPALSPAGRVAQIYVEQLRSNTHAAYVGTSAVTNDASGTGVIKELAVPPAATLPVDSWTLADWGASDTIEPTAFYGHGTTGEKLKVTYVQS